MERRIDGVGDGGDVAVMERCDEMAAFDFCVDVKHHWTGGKLLERMSHCGNTLPNINNILKDRFIETPCGFKLASFLTCTWRNWYELDHHDVLHWSSVLNPQSKI